MSSGETMTAVLPAVQTRPRVTGASQPRRNRRGPRNDVLFVRLWWMALIAAWILVSMFGLVYRPVVQVATTTTQLGWARPVLFPEDALESMVGPSSSQLAAALVWWPVVLVLGLLPWILVSLKVRFPVALASSTLVVLTPLVAWQGDVVLRAVIPGLIAAACWILASRTSRALLSLSSAFVAGLALARLPWSNPQMALPLSTALITIVAVMLLDGRGRSIRLLQTVLLSGLIALGAWWVVATGLGLSVAALFPVWPQLPAESVGLIRAFGAPFDVLVFDVGSSGVASAIAGTWTFLVVAWLMLALGSLWVGSWVERGRTLVVMAVVGIGFAWFLVPAAAMPTWLEPAQIDAEAVAAVWGIIVVIALALVFDAPRPWPLVATAVVATAMLMWVVAGAVTDQIGVIMQDAVLVVAATAVLTWLLLRKPGGLQGIGLALSVVAAGGCVGAVMGWALLA